MKWLRALGAAGHPVPQSCDEHGHGAVALETQRPLWQRPVSCCQTTGSLHLMECKSQKLGPWSQGCPVLSPFLSLQVSALQPQERRAASGCSLLCTVPAQNKLRQVPPVIAPQPFPPPPLSSESLVLSGTVTVPACGVGWHFRRLARALGSSSRSGGTGGQIRAL